MSFNAALSFIGLAVFIWPYLVIPARSRKGAGSEVRGKWFKLFPILDTIWIAVCVFSALFLLRQFSDYDRAFAVLSILVASIGFSVNLFSGLTGYYPERAYGGYQFYAGRFVFVMLGWVQIALLGVIAYVAALGLV